MTIVLSRRLYHQYMICIHVLCFEYITMKDSDMRTLHADIRIATTVRMKLVEPLKPYTAKHVLC